jgi:hypothetical protein
MTIPIDPFSTRFDPPLRSPKIAAVLDRLAVAVVLFALVLTAGGGANAQSSRIIRPDRNPRPYRFDLSPGSGSISNCLPQANATVTVFPHKALLGVDTLVVNVRNLLPNTSLAVFLTELPVGPFGAAQLIGELTTDEAGDGSLKVDSVIEQAFSTTVVGPERVRAELDHIVIWVADPAADDVCFAPITGPTTPFDADGSAGAVILSSRNFLPGAPIH